MSNAANLYALLAAALFMGAMVVVLYTDLTKQVIPGWITLALLVIFLPMAISSGLDLQTIALSVGAGLMIFMAGFGCYTIGILDGPEIKLAAVSALWLGPGAALLYVLWTAILGTMVTFAILALRRKRAIEAGEAYRKEAFLPYGPGMALAAIILFPQSSWAFV